MMQAICEKLKTEATEELYNNILPFWMEHTLDREFGGFYGRISNALTIDENAPKGLVLNTRILWTFSQAYNFSKNEKYLKIADRAFEYLMQYFLDQQWGGFVWLLDYKGNILDDKKRAYGQAFSIYSLAEYFRATKNQTALDIAIETFYLVEKYLYDSEHTGYFETANRDWTIADDLRLSSRDMNEKKSMNNHLHLVEGYAALLEVWPNDHLRKQLQQLLINFESKILDQETMHFQLFFDEKWHVKSANESYGHDIEGSWLLLEAAEILEDHDMIQRFRKIAVKLASVSRRDHLDDDGGISFEKMESGMNRERHWWVMAEAVVGYLNAFELTGDQAFLIASEKCWQFIKKHLVDKEYGEWIYMVDESGEADSHQYKVSEWKGPYHNTRACLEIIKRIENFSKKL